MNYIVRTKANRLMNFYYTKQQEINYKVYENNKWTREKNFVTNVKDAYTITMSDTGALYLFCQSAEGDIYLCQSEDGEQWSKRVILQNRQGKIGRVLFNGIIEKDGMTLIYNVPSEQEDTDYLMMQKVNERGEWAEAVTIDRIVPLANTLYQVQPIIKGHHLIYYQTKTPELKLGYREFTKTELGKLNVFLSTGYQIAGTSFLTTKASVHVLYIVRSLFGSQIIYRKKDSHNFSNPYVIWEGQRLTNCMLTIIKNKLYAAWSYNDELYYSVSDNFGNSFSRPIKHITYEELVKANYISWESMEESKFIMHEIYVHKSNPSGIGFLPEEYEGFYPIHKGEQEILEPPAKSYEKSGGEAAWPESDITPELDRFETNEEIENLKYKLMIFEREIDKKEREIMTLKKSLQSKNEEIAELDSKWKLEHRTLKDTVRDFERSKEVLTDENESLRDRIEELLQNSITVSPAEAKETEVCITEENREELPEPLCAVDIPEEEDGDRRALDEDNSEE